MRVAGRVALLVVAPAVPLLPALALVPSHRLGLLDAYLLVVAALALLTLLGALRRAGQAPVHPPGPAAAPAARPPLGPPRPLATRRPGDLEWLEQRLRLASASVFALHAVRSVVGEVVAHRLQAHHQVDLDADPATARRLLGPEVWELLQGDPEWGRGRDRPKLGVAQLRRVIEALERT